MVVRPSTSMRPIRVLGVSALTALVLNLAPPVAGLGWAAEPVPQPPAGPLAPGKPREPTSPPPGSAYLSKPANAVSAGAHQKKTTLGLKRKNGTMSTQEEGGTCWPYIEWNVYGWVDDYLEEAAEIDYSGGVDCDVTLQNIVGDATIFDRSPGFNGEWFDGNVLDRSSFWQWNSSSASTFDFTQFSAHFYNGGRFVEGALELWMEAPPGMTWEWCFIGLCDGLGTSSLHLVMSTFPGPTGVTRAFRDQSASVNDVEIARVSRPAPGTGVWASSQLVGTVPAILGQVMSFKANLCSTASTPEAAEIFATGRGRTLWNTAVTEAKNNTAGGDDRPLYWARIHMMAALRQWRPVVSTTNAERALDRASRGMMDHSFSPTSAKKAFISGFDPFLLDDGANAIMRSNPSAAAVLRLDGSPIGAAEVQAVIFPVRYDDFDAGLVEDIVDDHMLGDTQQATIINTVSQGGGAFELEVYNGLRRDAKLDVNGLTTEDNRKQVTAGTYLLPVVPSGLEGSSEFNQSTLPPIPLCSQCPYDLVSDPHTWEQEPPGFTTTTYTPIGYHPTWRAVEGSGGGFLSNELPYRVARKRDQLAPTVSTGHVHTPQLGAIPDSAGRYAISAQYQRILTALLGEPPNTTPSGIGISFVPDGDAVQCGGPTQQWVTSPGWTTPIRFNTDNRTGGCQLAFGIRDTALEVAGLTLTYRWQVSPGGDAGQCGNQGVFQVPITSFQVFGPMIRLDSDDRSGWCNLTFTISGRNDVELDIQLWPDGNAGRCVNYLPQGQYRTVRSGVPVTIGINADGRTGGCQFSLRLRKV